MARAIVAESNHHLNLLTMNKEFICVWTSPTYEQRLEIHNESFFAEKRGYNDRDRQELFAIKPNTLWYAEDGDHWVIRTK
jgi:hypothetical protein